MKKQEPGYLGRVSKGTSVEVRHLNDYAALIAEGVIDTRWSDFVNDALEHELARHKRARRKTT